MYSEKYKIMKREEFSTFENKKKKQKQSSNLLDLT